MLRREVTEFDLRAPEFQRADVKLEDYEFREDGKVVRKDRWQTGLRNVASALGWARREYEIPEVVERVRELSEPRFQWVCAHGCGACEVKRIEFAYETTEDLAGNELDKKTVPRLVSKCCGAPLMMWDNLKDEQIDVEVDPFPEPPTSGVDLPARPLPFDRAAVFTIWQGMQYQGGIRTEAQAVLFAQQVLAAHGLGEVPTYGVLGDVK